MEPFLEGTGAKKIRRRCQQHHAVLVKNHLTTIFLFIKRPPQAVVYKKDAIDQRWIENKKELFFFKMHDFEIFQTFKGSQNMNYSMMPAKLGDNTQNINTGKSELNLRKSAIAQRPNYQVSSDEVVRKSYFNPRTTQMKNERENNLFESENKKPPKYNKKSMDYNNYNNNLDKSDSYIPGLTINAESMM